MKSNVNRKDMIGLKVKETDGLFKKMRMGFTNRLTRKCKPLPKKKPLKLDCVYIHFIEAQIGKCIFPHSKYYYSIIYSDDKNQVCYVCGCYRKLKEKKDEKDSTEQ